MFPPDNHRPMPKRIDRFAGKYAFLSNFHRKPFVWSDAKWATAEHAFQASKTHDRRQQRLIRSTTPRCRQATRPPRRLAS